MLKFTEIFLDKLKQAGSKEKAENEDVIRVANKITENIDSPQNLKILVPILTKQVGYPDSTLIQKTFDDLKLELVTVDISPVSN